MNHVVDRGYTIIEAMIFLAITSALAVSILVGLSGQQERTQFSQGSRDAESFINDTMNDFVTGFSPVASVNCAGSGASAQGTNAGCTYIGKVIQFSPDGTSDVNAGNVRIFSIAGQQFKTPGSLDPVENIVEARPIVLTRNTVNTAWSNGMVLGTIPEAGAKAFIGGTWVEIGAVGFFSSFASTSGSGGAAKLSNGRQVTTVIAIPTTVLGQSESDAVAAIESLATFPGGYSTLAASYVNPDIRICLLRGGQRALIQIGDNQDRAATKLTIESGTTCP